MLFVANCLVYGNEAKCKQRRQQGHSFPECNITLTCKRHMQQCLKCASIQLHEEPVKRSSISLMGSLLNLANQTKKLPFHNACTDI